MLVPHGDIPKLAQAIVRVFQDQEYRMALEKGALEWAGRFNWDDAAHRMLEVLRDVVRKGRHA